MKYPQLIATPALVKDWLDSELEALGIDAAVYTHYILSILQKDIFDPPDEPFADITLMQEPLGRRQSRRRIREKGHCRSWDSEEDMKKSAAVDCLRSVSEQNFGFENLVDELCVKLKTLQSGDEEAKATISHISVENKVASDSDESQSSTPEEQAEKYYAAFPPLSDEVQSPVVCESSLTSVWETKKTQMTKEDTVNREEEEELKYHEEGGDCKREEKITTRPKSETGMRPLVPFFKLGEVSFSWPQRKLSRNHYEVRGAAAAVPEWINDDSEPEVEELPSASSRRRKVEKDPDALDGYNGDTSSRESSEDRDKPTDLQPNEEKVCLDSIPDNIFPSRAVRRTIRKPGYHQNLLAPPCPDVSIPQTLFTQPLSNAEMESFWESSDKPYQDPALSNTLATSWQSPPQPLKKTISRRASPDYKPKNLLLQFQALGDLAALTATPDKSEVMMDPKETEMFLTASSATSFVCLSGDRAECSTRSPLSILSPPLDCLPPDHQLIPGINGEMKGLFQLKEAGEKIATSLAKLQDYLVAAECQREETNGKHGIINIWYEGALLMSEKPDMKNSGAVWSTNDGKEGGVWGHVDEPDKTLPAMVTVAEKNTMVVDLETMMLEIDEVVLGDGDKPKDLQKSTDNEHDKPKKKFTGNVGDKPKEQQMTTNVAEKTNLKYWNNEQNYKGPVWEDTLWLNTSKSAEQVSCEMVNGNSLDIDQLKEMENLVNDLTSYMDKSTTSVYSIQSANTHNLPSFNLSDMPSVSTNHIPPANTHAGPPANSSLTYSQEASSFSLVHPRKHGGHVATEDCFNEKAEQEIAHELNSEDQEIEDEIREEMFKTIEGEKDQSEEGENLLVSPRTHFRPIRQESVDQYEDGTVFQIKPDTEALVFTRSSSGRSMLLQNEILGGSTPQKYMMYNWPKTGTEGADLLEDDHSHDFLTSVDKQDTQSPASFVPKFKKSKAEKFCQTDEHEDEDGTDSEQGSAMDMGFVTENECLTSQVGSSVSIETQTHIITSLQKTIQDFYLHDNESDKSPEAAPEIKNQMSDAANFDELVHLFFKREEESPLASMSLLWPVSESVVKEKHMPCEERSVTGQPNLTFTNIHPGEDQSVDEVGRGSIVSYMPQGTHMPWEQLEVMSQPSAPPAAEIAVGANHSPTSLVEEIDGARCVVSASWKNEDICFSTGLSSSLPPAIQSVDQNSNMVKNMKEENMCPLSRLHDFTNPPGATSANWNEKTQNTNFLGGPPTVSSQEKINQIDAHSTANWKIIDDNLCPVSGLPSIDWSYKGEETPTFPHPNDLYSLRARLSLSSGEWSQGDNLVGNLTSPNNLSVEACWKFGCSSDHSLENQRNWQKWSEKDCVDWPPSNTLERDKSHISEMRDEITADGEELFAVLDHHQEQEGERDNSPSVGDDMELYVTYESAVPHEYAPSYPINIPPYQFDSNIVSCQQTFGSFERQFLNEPEEGDIHTDTVKLSTELEEEWKMDEKPFYLQRPKNGFDRCRPSRRPCSFYLEGHCNRRDCRFAHDLSMITCRFWEEGSCFKGITCPFLHGYTDCSQKPTNRQSKLKRGFEIGSEKDFPSLSSSADSKDAVSCGHKVTPPSSGGKSSSSSAIVAGRSVTRRRLRRSAHRSGQGAIRRRGEDPGGGDDPSSSEDLQQRHSSDLVAHRQRAPPPSSRRKKRKSAGHSIKGAHKEPF